MTILFLLKPKHPRDGKNKSPESKAQTKPELPPVTPMASEVRPETSSGTGQDHVLPTRKTLFNSETIRTVAGVLAIVGAVFGAFHLVEGRIENAVENKLSDRATLRKIAAEVRPMLVFEVSTNGVASIIKDAGALRFIKDHALTVTERTKEGWPKTLRIDFVECLNFAPTLSAVNDSIVAIPDRDGGCAWKFEISPLIEIAGGSVLRIYRLELIW